ncbi:MAG: DNA polymerase III subunit alpha, partial [Schleiferiaceae bacterium]|nr:DNA polymerase III subunit alpha [Schleiferiaceae bacterium]
MFLIFDTETTGLPRDYNAPITDSDNWPRLVQLAWQVHDKQGQLVEVHNYIVKPEGFDIPFNAAQIHGISTERAKQFGQPLDVVLEKFNTSIAKCIFNVGHNIEFDINIMGAEYHRRQMATKMMELGVLDTKTEGTDFCQIPGGKGGKYKWPTLTELHQKLFGEGFDAAHNAAADVEATARCFLELVRIANRPDLAPLRSKLKFTPDDFENFRIANPNPIRPIGLNTQPYAPEELSQSTTAKAAATSGETTKDLRHQIKETAFSHLHNHTQFTVLQSTTQIGKLVAKAAADRMPAVALTDSGNMMGAFHFVREVMTYNKMLENRKADGTAAEDEIPLKAILGCELNVCQNRLDKNTKDNGYATVFLAKNQSGYTNLAKLSSIGFIEGFYYVPRIDKEAVVQHKENLMVTTGGLLGEVPYLILNVGEKQAEEAFVWWKEQFGDDFYVELLRHGLPEEDHVNQVLLGFAKKYNVKYFAANNSFYLDKNDANAHDLLLCVKDGERQSTPKGRGRGFRYGFPNEEFYFKTQEEMKLLFKDIPEAIATTQEIVDKVEMFPLEREVLLPKFEIPEEFIDPQDDEDGGKRGENAYLRHLTYEGAKRRYETITEAISERLDFELETIANTGYPGYFLIVQDFTTQARKMGVWVGPGRGSAAGSAVAYCIGITNVDPIKYDLLFERFLNPDRVSLPDIDIDFDDEGREAIINWVVEKYGSDKVAQIITYGTMAGKSAIRDTARVMDMPLQEADRLAKMMPDLKLNALISLPEDKLREKIKPEQMDGAKQLREIFQEDSEAGVCLRQAAALEGSLRNTGIHACGVIITPQDIREFIPVSVANKEASLWNTQFDNSVVESAGLLKMDFLGLKTLTIIKGAAQLVKERHGVDIDPDEIPLDDPKTMELYQRGETNGTFQFESIGMQKNLRQLKPDKFEDLIAMNALFRPGPMEYIPNFIARKHGREAIEFDLEGMDEFLEETYGITVYQEQVMLLSQKLAGFTKGEADVLRKAMGKKQKAVLDKMKSKFIDGAKERGHDPKMSDKVWGDWEKFAAYAFNKSHSTCYSVVAFQTAYLKAHYPAEFMASVLTNNMNDLKKLTFYMEECKRMGIKVLGPDINESGLNFQPNAKGEIRFGLGGMKGVGEAAVLMIIDERKKGGAFKNVFDLLKRIDTRAANKRTIEALILGGAFDNFPNQHRAVYFHQEQGEGMTFLEKAVKYIANIRTNENSAQVSLFGEDSGVQLPEPEIPIVMEWTSMEALRKEKEVNGIYISGHPLDDFKLEIQRFTTAKIAAIADMDNSPGVIGRDLAIAGIITSVQHRETRNGKPFGKFIMEDYSGYHEFDIWEDDYLKFRHFLDVGRMLFVKLRIEKNSWEKDGKKFERTKFRYTNFSLLQNLMDDQVKSLELRISITDLAAKVVDELEALLKKYPGEKKWNIQVVDIEEDVKLTMDPTGSKVGICPELLKELEDFPFQVKLN